jgi:hypothetical protein
MLPATRRETLFIDTNLLLVLIVGALDVDQVDPPNRTPRWFACWAARKNHPPRDERVNPLLEMR